MTSDAVLINEITTLRTRLLEAEARAERAEAEIARLTKDLDSAVLGLGKSRVDRIAELEALAEERGRRIEEALPILQDARVHLEGVGESTRRDTVKIGFAIGRAIGALTPEPAKEKPCENCVRQGFLSDGAWGKCPRCGGNGKEPAKEER